jgi:hypothetical protein
MTSLQTQTALEVLKMVTEQQNQSDSSESGEIQIDSVQDPDEDNASMQRSAFGP